MNVARDMARALVPRPIRNWLRSPGDALARVADELLHAVGADPEIKLRPGWQLRCHPAAWRGAYRVHRDDPPQVAELDAFIAACRPGMILFDLGAHYGLFSLATARYGGPEAVAIAVDPSEHALRMTRLMARLNGAEARVRTVRAAVAAVEGTLEMVDVGVQAMGYYVRADAAHGGRERTVVPTVTVDGLVAATGLAPTHVKVDVEGFEEDALRGAYATLRSAHPLVFLELHVALMRAAGKDPGAPVDLLAGAGYAFTHSDGTLAARGALLTSDLVRIVARPV